MVLLLLPVRSLPTIGARQEEPGRAPKNDARLLVQAGPRAGRLLFSYLVSVCAVPAEVCGCGRWASEMGTFVERIQILL